jgi:hypothetical protein
VARWCRCGLSVSGPFVRRCLTSLTMLPFPHPASSNRMGGFPASGSRRKVHDVAHGRWRGRLLRRTRPSTLCREALENRLVPDITLCLAHNH